jgi:hypothetical protein
LPTALDAASSAYYIGEVLDGRAPLPAPIAQQVTHLLQLASRL